MAVHTEDMSNVPNPGDRVPEGWYHVRISEVKEDVSEGGHPVVRLKLKIQDQGEGLGRIIPDSPSLQPHALFKLKAYYNATGYKPGPEGHDPEKLLDGECYVMVVHDTYEGRETINIPPWSVRSLQEGPGAKGKKK